MYRRPGKRGWYAFLDSDHKNISLKTDDEAEAKEAFAALLERSRVRELAPGDTPLSEIFAMTRERAEANHTPKTTYELHKNLRRVLAWLEERRIYSAKQVTRAVIEDYKSERRLSVSKRGKQRIGAFSINRDLNSWKKAMKVAVELRCAHKSVLDDFVKMREPRPEPHQRGLTEAELTRFFAAETDPAWRAYFRVTLGTGMRDEEVEHMQASDVRANAIVVTPKPPGVCACHPHGWTTKGYRYRTIPASKDTIKAAREFLRLRDTINLTNKKGAWKRIQSARKTAKITWQFSMHDFRRAWGSHLLKAGYRIEKISQWYGHADVTTTMRYLRVVDDAMPKSKDLPW